MDKKNIVKLHFLFWLIVITEQAVTIIYEFSVLPKNIIVVHSIAELLFRLFFFYLFYFSFPGRLNKKRDVVFAIITGLFVILLFNLPITYLYIFARYPEVQIPSPISGIFRYDYFDLLSSHFVFAIMGVLLKLIISWYINTKEQERLERQNLEEELSVLKTRISPSLLFNSLNYIKSIVKTAPAEASGLIIKLSEIMWYMLYDTDPEKVPLAGEIKFMRNYAELKDLPQGKPKIKLKTSGITDSVNIPPLLLIPLIENTYQNIDSKNKFKSPIIELSIVNGSLSFEISDYFQEQNGLICVNSENIIDDLRKRLKLVYGNGFLLEEKVNGTIKLEIFKL